MPGREESLDDTIEEIQQLGISRIVSLADLTEIRVKSEEYARAIEVEELPAILASCPIPDRGVPQDPEVFIESARDTASALKSGESVLVHCGAGIGRTGTYAAAVLLCFGLSKEQALTKVKDAGSFPETTQQLDLLDNEGLKN